MKLNEVALYENKSHRLLQEGWQELTEAQKHYQLRFEKELWPLLEHYIKIYEAALTPQQIDAIFTSAEQKAMASGSNKTMLGKAGSAVAGAAKLPIDIAKKVDAKINELGKMAQQAGPVQNADAKFEKLKQDILANKPDSKIVQGIKSVSDWAKENPGKASLAVGILTTIAAFIGGPAGGAAAGLVLRATKDLLQGEKLSTAVGKSVKTAAYGAIAGWALRGVGDWLEGLRADAVPYEKVPGLTQIDVGLTKTLTAPGFTSTETLGSMIVPQERAQEFIDLVSKARGGDTDAFKELWNFTKSFNIRDALADINASQAAVKAVAIANDEFLNNLKLANDAIAAIAQGTVTGKMNPADIKVDGKELKPEDKKAATSAKPAESMEEKFQQYLETQQIDEGPLDALKKGASAVGGALKKGAEKVANIGKNLGNKVTKDKLMKAWKAAGEPTEAGEVAKVLQQAGLDAETIKAIGAEQKINLPVSAKAEPGPNTTPSGQPKVEPKLDTPTSSPAASSQQSTNQPTGTQTPASTATSQSGNQATPAKLGPNAKQLTPIVNIIKKANVVDAVKAMLQKELDSASGAAPAPQQGQTAKPTGTAAPQQPAGSQPASATNKSAAPTANKAAVDTFEKAKGDIRKVQGGNKPIPPKNAQELQADIAKLAKGDKESGVFAAQKIMKLANLGVDVSKVQQQWLANAKAGERFLTQSVYYAITKMLREHNLGWADLGLRIRLVENTNDLVGVSYI